MPNPHPDKHPADANLEQFDLSQREPPDWRMLPILAVVCVVVFFILIPWLLLQFYK